MLVTKGARSVPTTDPRVDAYIAKSADFAKPILTRLRKVVHAGCPDVEETLKWNTPAFMYHGILCGMAGFKQHCIFGFWNGALELPNNLEAMGHFGRITSVDELPSDKVLIALVKKAAQLNQAGIKKSLMPKRTKGPFTVPADLKAALKKSAKARKTFEGFSPSNQREYVEWITEAKTDVTRTKRLETAIGWMEEGKPRHWKYMKPAATR
jgi:uncharacterized protein YdeI (YjbR/CyaY-like superfamily)